ncbi:MAG: sigma-54 dependent transcriptional regulator [candidate division KSB1 bacterium]|nr:sigma-54 dependent transcriptional regulator [candidate division KSB1 bacterium]
MITTKRICAVDNGGNFNSVLERLIRSRYNWSIDRLKDVKGLQGYLERIIPVIILIFKHGYVQDEEKYLRSLRSRHAIPPILAIIDPQCEGHDYEMDDFIFTPVREFDLIARIRSLTDSSYRQEIEVTKQLLKMKYGKRRIIGEDPILVEILDRLIPMAGIEAPVLLMGETGTGKELFARAIYYLSPRADKPFVAINCGAIPETIFENELFGHAPGAYTDAKTAHKGYIAAAEGGTLYLDEVNSIPSRAQVTLLRFLQEGKYRPLGSSNYMCGDVRIISSSNVDLINPDGKTNIRRDLFYRLNVFSVDIPPLRKRRSDIPLLVSHFARKHGSALKKEEVKFSEAALMKLMTYDWPGNVRELENIVQQSMVIASGSMVDEDHIELKYESAIEQSMPGSFKDKKYLIIDKFEKEYLKLALLYHNNNVSEAAQTAQMDRANFYRLLRKHNVQLNLWDS